MSFLRKEDEIGVPRSKVAILEALPQIVHSLKWRLLFTDIVLGRVVVEVPGLFGSQRLNISVDKFKDDSSKVRVTSEMRLFTWDPAKMRKAIDELRKGIDTWVLQTSTTLVKQFP